VPSRAGARPSGRCRRASGRALGELAQDGRRAGNRRWRGGSSLWSRRGRPQPGSWSRRYQWRVSRAPLEAQRVARARPIGATSGSRSNASAPGRPPRRPSTNSNPSSPYSLNGSPRTRAGDRRVCRAHRTRLGLGRRQSAPGRRRLAALAAPRGRARSAARLRPRNLRLASRMREVASLRAR